MNHSKITNVELESVDPTDAPDYVDAFIISADYDEEPMDWNQINEINEDADYVHECVINSLN